MVAIDMIFLGASSADNWLQLFLAEEQKSVNRFKSSSPIYFIYAFIIIDNWILTLENEYQGIWSWEILLGWISTLWILAGRILIWEILSSLFGSMEAILCQWLKGRDLAPTLQIVQKKTDKPLAKASGGVKKKNFVKGLKNWDKNVIIGFILPKNASWNLS